MDGSSYLSKLYGGSLALLTDLYQLTMCYGFWKLGIKDTQASFNLFFRKRPFGGSYAIAAGLENAIDFIENFRFRQDDLDYLASVKDSSNQDLFSEDFLEYLKSFKLRCDVEAVEEGHLVFPYEPILRVSGPLLDCQILESPLLNLINFPTLIATKASRIVRSAYPDEVVEFGIRRAQGIDGSISATRSCYIGGCHSTSNVIGGKLFDIPVRGTHSHSWVLAHGDESIAFENFADVMPNNCVFLIDTFNSIDGAKKAIEIAKKVKDKAPLIALRLDSGDLAKLSIAVRKLLDDAGLTDTKIMATNELDEGIIRDLKHQGAKINYWGVGTKIVTGNDQPALDGVYKLSAIQDDKGNWVHKLKISESFAKVTDPGLLKVRRYIGDNGLYPGDMIYDEILGVDPSSSIIDPLEPSKSMQQSKDFIELLKPIFKEGKLCYKKPSLKEVRETSQRELKKLDNSYLRFLNPHPYFVGLEKKLYNKKIEIITS